METKVKIIRNPLRWFEFKREAVILFANLKRNEKAHKHLDEYTRVVALISYIVGMLAYLIIYNLLCWIF